MSKRPLILVPPRREPMSKRLLSATVPEQLDPTIGVSDGMLAAILAAGGMPLVMPLTDDERLIQDYVDLCDGVALPGGPDVNPRRWGDASEYDPALLDERRDALEFPLVHKALAADKPLLALCRGCQVLNVALGGTLCMDVPGRTPREGMALWRHTKSMLDPIHPVEVREGSLLHRVVGSTMLQTNSWHHCCVERMGEGCELVAWATDGVPEGIEVTGRSFCLGVQWHPEYTWQKLPSDFALWRALVAAAAGGAR